MHQQGVKGREPKLPRGVGALRSEMAPGGVGVGERGGGGAWCKKWPSCTRRGAVVEVALRASFHPQFPSRAAPPPAATPRWHVPRATAANGPARKSSRGGPPAGLGSTRHVTRHGTGDRMGGEVDRVGLYAERHDSVSHISTHTLVGRNKFHCGTFMWYFTFFIGEGFHIGDCPRFVTPSPEFRVVFAAVEAAAAAGRPRSGPIEHDYTSLFCANVWTFGCFL